MQEIRLNAVSTMHAVATGSGHMKSKVFESFLKSLDTGKEKKKSLNKQLDEAKLKGLNIEDR